MTTKMSNGMAANIKTMVGLVVTGLVAVSTPAWGADKFVMRGYFTGITLPNKVKFDTLPKAGKELTFLTFTCPNDGTSRATAVVQGWGSGKEKEIAEIKQSVSFIFGRVYDSFIISPTDILRSMNTLGAQDGFSQPCNTMGVDVYLKNSVSSSTLAFLKSNTEFNKYYEAEFNELKNQELFVNFRTPGNFKITKNSDGAWTVEDYK
jgi:hypothetical protein